MGILLHCLVGLSLLSSVLLLVVYLCGSLQVAVVLCSGLRKIREQQKHSSDDDIVHSWLELPKGILHVYISICLSNIKKHIIE